jgi:hypothetical protein
MPLVDGVVSMLRRLLHWCGPPIIAAVIGGLVAGLVADRLGPPPPPEPPLFSTMGPLRLTMSASLPPLVDPLDPAPAVVVARADWDDTPSTLARLRHRARPPSSTTHIVVHHSDFDDAPGPAVIRDYHRGPAGFSDIGYHLVVARDGTVFEGRPLDRVGAHAGVAVEQRRDVRLDPDEDSIGVVLDGAFMHQRPDPTQLAAAARVIRDLRARFGIPARQVIGHRDVKHALVEARGLTLKGDGTVCPGEAAFELLPALRLFSEPLPSSSSPSTASRAGVGVVAATTRPGG